MIERAIAGSGRPIRSSASRQPNGPAPQFTPIASTPASASAAAAASGVVPSAATSSSPKVISATIGRSAAARRASSIARRRWSSSDERLDDEQVDPALEQAVDLLAERRPDRRLVVAGELAGRSAERPDRPGDQDVAAADVARLAGDLGATPVEPGASSARP